MKEPIQKWKVVIDTGDIEYATDARGEEMILTGTFTEAQHELDNILDILEERYGMIEHAILESQGVVK